MVIFSLLAVALVSSTSLESDLAINMVEVDDREAQLYSLDEVAAVASIDDLNAIVVEEGETLEVEVTLEAESSAKDIQVEVELRGYEYDDISDRSEVSDIDVSPEGTGTSTVDVNLDLELPARLDKDRYLLRITVDDKDSAPVIRNIALQVKPARHSIEIADVAFSPGNTVQAGRALLTDVLLANFGDKDEKDVRVNVAIPELGVKALPETVNVVSTDDHNLDYEDVTGMFVPIPANAAAGEYQVLVTVDYDLYSEQITEAFTINVVEDARFQAAETLVLAVGPEIQSISQGTVGTYAVALTNAGHSSNAYLLSVQTGDWATSTLSDSLVVLEPGRNQVVYVDVTPSSNAAPGAHAASLTIQTGDGEMLETISLQTNVLEGNGRDRAGLRSGLEIALIVLVVLLVIIGLIVGFSRLRRDDEGEEQTYY